MKRLLWVGLVGVFMAAILSVPLNLKNDLDGNLFHPLFMRHSLATGNWANWNPYLHQGLPTMGDPINFFWYPLTVLILLLPVHTAVQTIFLLSFLFTIVFGYFLFRHSRLTSETSSWMALAYAGSSYLFARIVAGHLEKVLSYPLIPLFLLMILRLWQKPNWRNAGHSALGLFLVLSTSDMYNFFYLAIGYGFLCVYILLAQRHLLKHFILGGVLVVLFSAVRWIPMLPVLDNLFKIPDPYSGSQNLVSLFLQMTWLRPSLFRFLVPTNFGWWEKTAFVGPVFALVLAIPWCWKKIRSNPAVVVASVFALVCVAIAMPASVINPWHWAITWFPQLALFHVPTRILGVLTLCLLIVVGQIIAILGKWGLLALRVNIILLAVFWLFILNFRMFPTVLHGYAAFENRFFGPMNSVLYPAFEFPVLERDWQTPAALFHTTHGTYIAKSASADMTNHLVTRHAYTNIVPNYLVWPDQSLPLPFVASAVASGSGITLYKTATPSGLSSQGSVVMGVDRFVVNLNEPASQAGRVEVYQSWLPGWSGFPSEDGYLASDILPGQTQVIFSYLPKLYYIGATVSLIALGGWAYSTRKTI